MPNSSLIRSKSLTGSNTTLLNTANINKGTVVELYRVVFDPVSDFDLINDELAQFELTGSVLYDDTRNLDPVLGGFGRLVQEQ